MAEGVGRSVWPWAMLPARLVLFAAAQSVFALALWSWDAAIAYWPISATLANLATIALLAWLFGRDGRSYADVFRIDRGAIGRDLLVLVPILLVMAPMAYFPNVWLATWLMGSPEASLDLLIRPLPWWAALLAFSFPLTIVFAELPCYFAYCMPRIAIAVRRPWLSVMLAAVFLALQHIALPLVFEPRFMSWRALMFLPFAVFVGAILRWRPQLLPYLVVVHGLLDLSVVAMLLAHAT